MNVPPVKDPDGIMNFAFHYYESLKSYIDDVVVTGGQGETWGLYDGVKEAAGLILSRAEMGNKLLFIGNGASAAISSHMATDYWKNQNIPSLAFNDPSLLTCIGNDYGYEFVFEKPIEMFAEPGDVLMAISSSGRSINILRGVEAAFRKGCRVITLSGFKPENPLRSAGDLNFYVPAENYGPVEVLHHSICHCILDYIRTNRKREEDRGE